MCTVLTPKYYHQSHTNNVVCFVAVCYSILFLRHTYTWVKAFASTPTWALDPPPPLVFFVAIASETAINAWFWQHSGNYPSATKGTHRAATTYSPLKKPSVILGAS